MTRPRLVAPRQQRGLTVEAAVHAIEISATPLETLLVGERLPDAVFVPPSTLHTQRHDAVAALARRERYGDVEVAVEPVALVEAADLEQDVASDPCAVPLDRLGLAARDLVEVFEVRGAEPPRSHQADAGIAERSGQRTKEIAGDLDRAVQHEDHAASRDARERVARRAFAKIAVGEVNLDASIARGDRSDRVLGVVARARVDDEHLTVRREKGKHAGETAREVGRVLARDDSHRP